MENLKAFGKITQLIPEKIDDNLATERSQIKVRRQSGSRATSTEGAGMKKSGARDRKESFKNLENIISSQIGPKNPFEH